MVKDIPVFEKLELLYKQLSREEEAKFREKFPRYFYARNTLTVNDLEEIKQWFLDNIRWSN